MVERIRQFLIPALGAVLSIFVVFEVNFAWVTPLSQLAVFAMLGMVLCFLSFPVHPKLKDVVPLRIVDLVLSVGAVVCCSYLIFSGTALGQRAGAYTGADIVIGTIGIILVIESTRRSIGLALPILATVFLVYAMVGPSLPDWLFPHRGYGIDRIVAQTFLRTEGVFGTALRVMFTYVFLFVIFGAFLEVSGATQFIIDFAEKFFGRSPGGPAKVAVLGSGLMGSLSGSAVANAVTTGTFTIPMMRNAGFKPHVAAGITAAAASGGALVPPVMGAGAYMMLEIVDPPVTFIQIAKAAIIPATLYYLSIFLIVHFYARRVGVGVAARTEEEPRPLMRIEGLIFFGALAALIGLLISGYSPFRAVTFSLLIILVMSMFTKRTRITPAKALEALTRSARNGISLVSASACVGIIIGIVTLTGVGTAFPNTIIPLAERSLFLALVAIMLSSIVLGMGLPSAVCYLLMATLIGPVLNKLGVIPLAAHLFIFYFGMMSMVTPPVALAAYASASIAGANIMSTGLAAFRFSLVGFTLPYMFVYRPELLLLANPGDELTIVSVIMAVGAAVLGIAALAGGIAGYLFAPLGLAGRAALFAAAALLLYPDAPMELGPIKIAVFDTAGAVTLIIAAFLNFTARGGASDSGDPQPEPEE